MHKEALEPLDPVLYQDLSPSTLWTAAPVHRKAVVHDLGTLGLFQLQGPGLGHPWVFMASPIISTGAAESWLNQLL